MAERDFIEVNWTSYQRLLSFFEIDEFAILLDEVHSLVQFELLQDFEDLWLAFVHDFEFADFEMVLFQLVLVF